MNTHAYDGKIKNELYFKQLTLDEKLQKGQELLQCLNNPYLQIIINDIGTSKNYDPTNCLNADDLLCLCWEYKDDEDFIQELNIQLLDMATGFCPQGRTHRLYQLLVAFKND